MLGKEESSFVFLGKILFFSEMWNMDKIEKLLICIKKKF